MSIEQFKLISRPCLFFVVWTVSLIPFSGRAQYPSFELGGLARGVADVGLLSPEDTVVQDVSVESHALYDLALRGEITPKAQVYIELRLGTNLALFDTSASYAQVRRVVLSGSLLDNWSYEIGDVDVAWTPFTIWNSPSEGVVNESMLFAQWRQLQNYENFSVTEAWRLRGARFHGGWTRDSGTKLKSSSFISRIQESDEVFRPDVIFAGSALEWIRNRASLAIRAQDFATLGSTVIEGKSSHVVGFSGEASWTCDYWTLRGEAGGSLATRLVEDEVQVYPAGAVRGGYWHLSGTFQFKEDWQARVSARSVSDTYISPGAQTKRILYSQSPQVFPLLNNGQWGRSLMQGDLLTARTHFQQGRPWNRVLQRGLMHFDPRYGTAMPYGLATPNRRALSADLEQGKPEDLWSIRASLSILQDLTPEGSPNRRHFLNTLLSGHANLDQWWHGSRTVRLQGGWQRQRVSRAEAALEPVNVIVNVLDAGLDWFVSETLVMSYGIKRIAAEGLDYLALRNQDFTVIGFDRVDLNVRDELHAWGLTWRLNENTEATLQWQQWSVQETAPDHRGIVSRVLFLFQTTF
jgi:hypothetical protein